MRFNGESVTMTRGEISTAVAVLLAVFLALVAGYAGCFMSMDGGEALEDDDFHIEPDDEPAPRFDVDRVDVEPVEALQEREEPQQVAPAEKESAPKEGARLPTDDFDDFVEAFHEHYDESDRSLLHVTLDRPMYRPGQPIRWQSWHLEPGSFGHHGSDGRDVEVELLDPRGTVVKDETVELQRGLANGEFEIDEDAKGGVWVFRIIDGDKEYERPVLFSEFEAPRFRQEVDFSRPAYQPGEEVTASVEILRDTGDAPAGMDVEGYVQLSGRHIEDVAATLDIGGQAEIEFRLPETIESDDAALVLSVEEGGMVETEVFPIPLALEDVMIDFQPEGGALVEGLTSRVYFEATDLSATPVEVQGEVIDDRGLVVEEISTSHEGRGRFEFTPEPGREYSVALKSPSAEQTYELPEASEEGCVLRLYDDYDSLSDSIRAGVWCHENRVVGIVGAMADQIFDITRMVAGPEHPASVHLRPDDGKWPRSAGTARVTVLEDDGDITPLADRVTFRGRRAQLGISIEFDKSVYHPGERAEMVVETMGLEGEPLAAELVKAVVDDRVYARAAHQDVPSILGRLLLGADDLHFWADVEEADQYFDLYEDSAAGLDLLMGTRGWRASDKRDAYYVDGGEVKLPKPPPVVRHRPRRPRRPRPARARMPEPEEAGLLFDASDMGSMGDEVMLFDDGGGRSAQLQAAAPPAPEPRQQAPEQEPQQTPEPESGSSEEHAGPIAPQMFRDDDAVAFSAWKPELTSQEDGRLLYAFELPEAVGAYRVAVEGVSESGLLGRAEEVVPVEVPLSVVTRLPEILSGGDRVEIPVTLRNATDDILDTTVEMSVDGPASIVEEAKVFDIKIPSGSTATQYVPILVDDARGEITIQAFAQGGGFTDGAQRQVEIEPRGFQRSWHASGELPGTDRHQVPLMGMTEAGANAELVIYPSAVSQAIEGVASMARRPTGCFEQTSSANHPNLMVWQYLEQSDELDEEMRSQLRSHIMAGYQRLLGFEAEGGGFEWFGRTDGQAHLTAWGLVQFSLMQDIVEEFDPAIIERSVEFLQSLSQPDGSWRVMGTRSWLRMSSEQQEASELFVLYGLARAGRTAGFEPQFERAVQVGKESDNAYEVALVAAALAYADWDQSETKAVIDRLVQLQESDGSWSPSGGRSWAGGFAQAFNVETTAVATLALIEAGAPVSAITPAIEWLDGQRTRMGWWGTTQATVMALEARISYEREGLEVTDGPVTLTVGGAELGRAHVSADDQRPIRIDDFGDALKQGENQLQIHSDIALSYDVEITYRVEQFDVAGDGPLDFNVWVADMDEVAMGDEVSVQLQLKNLESQALGMVVARVILPAGVEVASRELAALVDRTPVDFYETTGREIVLYFDDLDGDEEHQIRFSATAAVPGAYELPASVAFPYYRDESSWQWGERSEFIVGPPR